MTLPKGLEETIRAFFNGCEAGGKEADKITITLKMVERLMPDFEYHQDEWDKARNQLMAVAGLCGRLAALYAAVDNSEVIEWPHARRGLRDGKAECRQVLGALRAKHCLKADLEND